MFALKQKKIITQKKHKAHMPFSEESPTLVSMLFSLSFNHYYILNLIFIASFNKHMHKCKHTLVLIFCLPFR